MSMSNMSISVTPAAWLPTLRTIVTIGFQHSAQLSRSASNTSHKLSTVCGVRAGAHASTSRKYVDMSEKVGHVTYPGQVITQRGQAVCGGLRRAAGGAITVVAHSLQKLPTHYSSCSLTTEITHSPPSDGALVGAAYPPPSSASRRCV